MVINDSNTSTCFLMRRRSDVSLFSSHKLTVLWDTFSSWQEALTEIRELHPPLTILDDIFIWTLSLLGVLKSLLFSVIKLLCLCFRLFAGRVILFSSHHFSTWEVQLFVFSCVCVWQGFRHVLQLCPCTLCKIHTWVKPIEEKMPSVLVHLNSFFRFLFVQPWQSVKWFADSYENKVLAPRSLHFWALM